MDEGINEPRNDLVQDIVVKEGGEHAEFLTYPIMLIEPPPLSPLQGFVQRERDTVQCQ